jgi:xanthine dioxygenase
MQYQVVIVKGQQSLAPKKNWELLERLDPEASPYSSEEFGKLFHPTGQGLIVRLTLFQRKR